MLGMPVRGSGPGEQLGGGCTVFGVSDFFPADTAPAAGRPGGIAAWGIQGAWTPPIFSDKCGHGRRPRRRADSLQGSPRGSQCKPSAGVALAAAFQNGGKAAIL